jgi:hypothetical protein
MSAHNQTDGYLNWIHTGSPFPNRCENCRRELPAHWEDELCAKCQHADATEADERAEAREGL